MTIYNIDQLTEGVDKIGFPCELNESKSASVTGYKARFAVVKSQKQMQLEAQGCIFRGGQQELLDNHERDPMKDCYCGRPNRILDKAL